ncbi:YdcF family protein [Cronbergia sp. UHCC 0137]|uniref:YdcF family protein n=1 Tax=Cronbergia sp. UHCC 0137 TaxID=3110239 RepID=UPI002B20196B|nr:YdcF family protein [Cronbergia sp. UHCC 0137]MEA5619741.1 YdcF family protein [Cronbergia sp. UHCC 0137]
MKRLYQQWKKYRLAILSGIILVFCSHIPIRIAIASYQAPIPQAILTLGGDPNREKFTAQFAQQHPHLDIWVSSGISPELANTIFQTAGVSKSRLHLDYRAVDTVTNFTTLVDDLKQHQIQHIYLITSEYHLPRAKTIATIVLGSQGITFTPISIPSQQPKESTMRIVRDSARAVLWIISGKTGASFNPRSPLYAFR